MRLELRDGGNIPRCSRLFCSDTAARSPSRWASPRVDMRAAPAPPDAATCARAACSELAARFRCACANDENSERNESTLGLPVPLSLPMTTEAVRTGGRGHASARVGRCGGRSRRDDRSARCSAITVECGEGVREELCASKRQSAVGGMRWQIGEAGRSDRQADWSDSTALPPAMRGSGTDGWTRESKREMMHSVGWHLTTSSDTVQQQQNDPQRTAAKTPAERICRQHTQRRPAPRILIQSR